MRLTVTYKDGVIEERECDKKIISITQSSAKDLYNIINRKDLKVVIKTNSAGFKYEFMGITPLLVKNLKKLIKNQEITLFHPSIDGIVANSDYVPVMKYEREEVLIRTATKEELIRYAVLRKLI